MEMKTIVMISKTLLPIFNKLKEKSIWKKMILDTGDKILSQEHDIDSEIFSQLEVLFSDESLKELATTSFNESGYEIITLIKNKLEDVFAGYNVEEKNREKYIQDFLKILKAEIKKRKPDLYTQVFMKEFRDENNKAHKALQKGQKEIIKNQTNNDKKLEELIDTKKLYMTIDQVDNWLKESTDPSISLNFFNYEDEQFVDEIKRNLSKNEIYIQGKTREEVVYYLLYIIKSIGDKDMIDKVCVVNSLDAWKKLKGSIKNYILIPNFNAQEISIIPQNKNIIVFGEEDFTGNKNPIKLRNRIRSNIYDKLKNEDVRIDLINNIVDKSNGLFTIFKRQVFKGKLSKPKWEKHKGRVLIPALLLGKWTENDGDMEIISRLSGKQYTDYIDAISNVIGGEDPFILKNNRFNKAIYKIANIEESWEILFNLVSENDIKNFKDIVNDIILSIDPIFNLPPSEHYYASLKTEEPKYSLQLKSGLIRTLIMLANRDGHPNNLNITYTQSFVDEIMDNLFNNVSTKKQWFGLSQLLNEMVEASPAILTTVLEKEVINYKSSLWAIFEEQSDGFTGRNYYTHVLWAIEKLLYMNDYTIRALLILAKLSEKNIDYKISNTPVSTLSKALCAWKHEINITINEKVQVVEKIVNNYINGWEILKNILPTRSSGGIFTSLNKPQYRYYKFIEELETRKQIWDTYREYLKIAVKAAEYDIERWIVIFEDCLFFEFDLEDEIFKKVKEVISNFKSDSEKYKLKKQIRSIISRHRFYKDANWSMKEEHVNKLEQEVFNQIIFDNPMYDYLYLFNSYEPKLIKPEPYPSEYDYKRKREKINHMQINAVEHLSQLEGFSFLAFIRELDDEASGELGAIIAEKVHEYNLDMDFLLDLSRFKKISILRSYLLKIHNKKGNSIIEEILTDEKSDLLPLEVKFQILSISRIDDDFFLFVEGLNNELKEYYWKHIRIFGNTVEKNYLDKFVNKMILYHNYGSALEIVNQINSFDVEIHLEILEKILKNQDSYTLKSNDDFNIRNSFEFIYEKCYSSKKFKNRIIALEMAYTKLLSRDFELKYLLFELRNNPNFVADLVKLSYKSNFESETEKKLNSEEKAKVEIAFNILYNIKFCPGVNDDGSIDEKILNTWVDNYLKLIEENNQEEIGRVVLGGFLAYSPVGFDRIYPHEAVRKIIEKYYTKEIESGFHTEVFNKRGVYWGSAGKEEKTISEKYLKYANAIKISSPKTSQILKSISRDYQRQSQREREMAENGL